MIIDALKSKYCRRDFAFIRAIFSLFPEWNNQTIADYFFRQALAFFRISNILERDFHADKPNQKWFTDITEFAIPAGKVYLSPIIDCFDGMLVCWKISTSPDASLVNAMRRCDIRLA